ncbi:hypothetical protein CCS92_33445, partial [Methylobacterium radiotolerans]
PRGAARAAALHPPRRARLTAHPREPDPRGHGLRRANGSPLGPSGRTAPDPTSSPLTTARAKGRAGRGGGGGGARG